MQILLAGVGFGVMVWACLAHVYGAVNIKRLIASRLLESAASDEVRQKAEGAKLAKRLDSIWAVTR